MIDCSLDRSASRDHESIESRLDMTRDRVDPIYPSVLLIPDAASQKGMKIRNRIVVIESDRRDRNSQSNH